VDLKDLLASGLTTTGINPTTGLLQLMNGSTDVGTLKFDVATLASTTAHIGTDTTGHAVITV